MAAEFLTPLCPLCSQPPFMVMGGGTQAFCGNDDGCPVFTWDPSVSLDENLLSMRSTRWEPTEGKGDE